MGIDLLGKLASAMEVKGVLVATRKVAAQRILVKYMAANEM